MKLITHNMLSSKFLKGVQTGFPLKVFAEKLTIKEQEFNPDFVKRMLPKLEYSALKSASDSVLPDNEEKLPTNMPENWSENDDFLKRIHHILLEVEVEEGHLECPETARKFNITKGIPNMLANADEVA